MISRKSAMAVAIAYTSRFSGRTQTRTIHGGSQERVYRNELYDFLYENDYEPWFCNLAKHPIRIRDLKELVLKLHTGESIVSSTLNWSWKQRAALGQTYLRNLAQDFVAWHESEPSEWYKNRHQGARDEIVRRMELDGYALVNCEFRQMEIEVLDVEAETGLLEKLHADLELPDRVKAFSFLSLAEDHYVAGRWADCIGNCRKFFEAVLQQVATKHAIAKGFSRPSTSDLERPAAMRRYLEDKGLLEVKEREAVDKIYGLLSHTGGHPYMAEEDQARLLRQVSLTMTQFILLRLQGAVRK